MIGAATAALTEMPPARRLAAPRWRATAANAAARRSAAHGRAVRQYLPQPTVLVFEVFLGVLAAAAAGPGFSYRQTVTRRERPTLRFKPALRSREGRGEFIAAGVAAFAPTALNGLFASVYPASPPRCCIMPITRSRAASRACSSRPVPSPR